MTDSSKPRRVVVVNRVPADGCQFVRQSNMVGILQAFFCQGTQIVVTRPNHAFSCPLICVTFPSGSSEVSGRRQVLPFLRLMPRIISSPIIDISSISPADSYCIAFLEYCTIDGNNKIRGEMFETRFYGGWFRECVAFRGWI